MDINVLQGMVDNGGKIREGTMSYFGFNPNNVGRQLSRIPFLPVSGSETGVNAGIGGLAGAGSQGVQFRDPRLSLLALLGNETLKLNAEETSLFLKDAMKLPQEMKLLLMMLALESTPAAMKTAGRQTLKQAIEQSLDQLTIPLEDVQKLLDKGNKEGSDKLLKLLQADQIRHSKSGQQIAEMMTSLGKMSERIQASPMQAAETLILLYLPFYPLAMGQRLELAFEFQEGEEGGNEQDISVTLYLETNALGRFKVSVFELEPLQILTVVHHEKAGEGILKPMEQDLNENLAKDGLPAAIFKAEQMQSEHLKTLQSASTEGETSLLSEEGTVGTREGFEMATRQKADQKQITVQPGTQLSVLVLNTAYVIARFIFESDEQHRKLQSSQ